MLPAAKVHSRTVYFEQSAIVLVSVTTNPRDSTPGITESWSLSSSNAKVKLKVTLRPMVKWPANKCLINGMIVISGQKTRWLR